MGISEIFYNLDIEIESSKQEINNYIYDNYVSKDKIRANIKELEILKMTSFANNEISKQVYKEQIDLINMQINVLKELLEE